MQPLKENEKKAVKKTNKQTNKKTKQNRNVAWFVCRNDWNLPKNEFIIIYILSAATVEPGYQISYNPERLREQS